MLREGCAVDQRVSMSAVLRISATTTSASFTPLL
jgi:hypothetical protein